MKNIFAKTGFIVLLFLMGEVVCGKSHFQYNISGYTSFIYASLPTYYVNLGDTLFVSAVCEYESDFAPTWYEYGPFDWYRDTTLIAHTSELLITQSGTYKARYSHATPFIVIFGSATRIKDFASDESLKIFPNPFANQIHLALNLEQPAPVDFKLYDVFGKETYATSYSSTNQLDEELDLAFLPEGMYVAVLTTSGKKVVKRMMKSR